MEADNASTFSAKPPPLSSDQLNYLIWRYLQESGYADAAVKLQRDWRVDAESLPFAKCVKGHALVSLVQKGLRYHHLSLTIDENGRPSKQLNPSMFFFGPESEKPPLELPEEALPSTPSPHDSLIAPQKQTRDPAANGLVSLPVATQLAPKRGRKTAASSERNGSATRKPSASANRAANTSAMDVDMVNGHVLPISDARSPTATDLGPDDAGPFMNGIKADERMDVDEDSLVADQHNHEPQIEVVPPPTHTLLIGESRGVQVTPAKVVNLAQSSTIFNLPPPTVGDVPRSLTRVTWQPSAGNALTAMGDDFCGIWDITPGSPTASTSRFQELVDSTGQKLISAVAWEPHGDMIAIATYTNLSGHIFVFDGQELCMVEDLTASQRAVTSMIWQAQGSSLFGLAPYDSDDISTTKAAGSSIIQWHHRNLPAEVELSTVRVPETLMDMDGAFLDETGIVCAAGQNSVYSFRISPALGIEQKWTSDPTANDQWTFVRCTLRWGTSPFLVAASAETGTLWMPTQNLFKRGAHEAHITGLELRPRPATPLNASSRQEFATSSMDGTIKVWRYDDDSNSITSVCKLIVGHGSPIMALSYSPDGFCLAGASYDTVRIWNSEHDHNHMASWKDEQNLWNGSKLKDDDMMSTGGRSSVNGDAYQVTADHTLAWDGDSKKLAFGLGSQVAIINFER
ncbi:hypothetical protein G647_00264 [Cladophialophora carrionii CBS 160.54]|uniref:LisH domain-containing protein n=1 Tax=Cladophialophora carrionii CBS 160.54 TaxID=1279043 RepID=V9DLT0_9EURO|nr:uncharacterized protein G647_00264 [Cladophialophora carrionii CBS 160.54]ETI27815.1 hypothetical protein G647_00264 [Cladophialophora carrionii CBS 160.54]